MQKKQNPKNEKNGNQTKYAKLRGGDEKKRKK